MYVRNFNHSSLTTIIIISLWNCHQYFGSTSSIIIEIGFPKSKTWLSYGQNPKSTRLDCGLLIRLICDRLRMIGRSCVRRGSGRNTVCPEEDHTHMKVILFQNTPHVCVVIFSKSLASASIWCTQPILFINKQYTKQMQPLSNHYKIWNKHVPLSRHLQQQRIQEGINVLMSGQRRPEQGFSSWLSRTDNEEQHNKK